MASSPNAGRLLGGCHRPFQKTVYPTPEFSFGSRFLVGYAHLIFSWTRLFVSLIFSNAEWIASSDLTLLGSAYESTRIALQREAGLTDADLDTLTDVMGDALLSLYRAGQINETKLTNYAVAKTLRYISASQR
jgi:hypothetical protein